MADAKFARATSWEEALAIHRRFMHDYNVQRHWALEQREDGKHSPAAVLGDQKGTVYPESVLSRILFATRYVRRLDKFGFLRYQDWKFYGERGLAEALDASFYPHHIETWHNHFPPSCGPRSSRELPNVPDFPASRLIRLDTCV